MKIPNQKLKELPYNVDLAKWSDKCKPAYH